jgi:hypothetical protein
VSAHDRWLAGYHRWDDTAWCSNLRCDNHYQHVHVEVESEYGQSWANPEECPLCHSEWQWQPPSPDDAWNRELALRYRAVQREGDLLAEAEARGEVVEAMLETGVEMLTADEFVARYTP